MGVMARAGRCLLGPRLYRLDGTTSNPLWTRRPGLGTSRSFSLSGHITHGVLGGPLHCFDMTMHFGRETVKKCLRPAPSSSWSPLSYFPFITHVQGELPLPVGLLPAKLEHVLYSVP